MGLKIRGCKDTLFSPENGLKTQGFTATKKALVFDKGGEVFYRKMQSLIQYNRLCFSYLPASTGYFQEISAFGKPPEVF